MTKLNVPVIRELLRNKGMALWDLARLMGISPGILQTMLDREHVAIPYAKMMADMLNVPIVKITLAA